VTHDVTVVVAAAGVVGLVLAGACILLVLAALAGLRGPLDSVRSALWGYELWAAFVVSASATGASLFFSEIANFVPCELCWYQRICLYPLSIITLLAALASDYRVARYLLALPVVGAMLAVYHLLVENGVVSQSSACLVSAPGGCATKWIDEFGFITIPTLSLAGFVLLIELLGFAALGSDGGGATLGEDA
jgi:disulfide bond formation protein DsbB